MPKVVSIAALVAAWSVAAASAQASTSTTTRTVHPVRYTTRYHDVTVTHRAMQVRRIVTVTRIQPVIHVLWETRIRHRTVYEHVARGSAPGSSVLGASYQCGCGS